MDQLLLRYKCYGSSMPGMYFYIILHHFWIINSGFVSELAVRIWKKKVMYMPNSNNQQRKIHQVVFLYKKMRWWFPKNIV